MVTEAANSSTNVVTAKDHIQQPNATPKVEQNRALPKTQPHEQHKNHLPTHPQAAPIMPTKPQISETHKDITTPIKVEVLEKLLLGYQNKAYLINGFKSGFRLGFTGPRNYISSDNLKSCRDHPDIVQEKINSELKAKRVKGPFAEPLFLEMKISPIGIVPKKAPGQYRLIHHLSFPSGSSVNDYIDPAWASVKYASFDDAVECLIKFGRYTQMAKTDIDSAFRLIPIHPSDHPLLAFKFGSAFYYDSCLPFGASSSCAIFEAFSSALEWVAKRKCNIDHIVHILDDFLILESPYKNQCNEKLSSFLSMCSNLGAPIKKKKKVEYATTCITFMGLELDSAKMEARLPQDKLEKVRLLLT